jgi:hypothetical protein
MHAAVALTPMLSQLETPRLISLQKLNGVLLKLESRASTFFDSSFWENFTQTDFVQLSNV